MIKTLIAQTLLIFFLLAVKQLSANNEKDNEFDAFFEDKTLRIDFLLTGDAVSEEFVLKELKMQTIWAGSKTLSDKIDLDLGTYRIQVFDSATNQLIYKNGFCSLFNEYQTTETGKTIKESYYHVVQVPFPKKTIQFILEKRKWDDGKFYLVKKMHINPRNYFIIKEKAMPYNHTQIQGDNNIAHKIDIAFLAEGYTKAEMKKFRSDVNRVWAYISSIAPFDAYSNMFNIYAVECPSVESGTDIPGEDIYKNTVFNSTFYTFNTDRYLTTSDLKSLYDAASCVPHDQLFVLINSDRYGGGGFYNYYSSSTSNHELSLKVALHEFGHGFAGLADEYYSSDVPYDAFYNQATEPWEPNITTLFDFDKKWKNRLPKGTSIPTERTLELKDSIGVYEGGGYLAKGIYSPFQDCRMKSNVPASFCPVCSEAIIRVIEYNTK